MHVAELGAALATRRKAVGLGQEELAELAQVSVRFVRAIEHGKATARLDKVLAVATVLGFEIDLRLRRQ